MNSCNDNKPVLRLPRQKQSETVTHYYMTDEPPVKYMTEKELLEAFISIANG